MKKIVSIVAAALLACGSSAALAQNDPVAVFDLPASESCIRFPLHVELFGSRTVYREYRDKYGDLVRIFSGGKGYALKFVNPDSGNTLSLRPNGSNDTTTFNADGTQTIVTTGHYVLIYFSTDAAAGGVPFVRQYVGRVVQNVNPSTGVFTLLRSNGTVTDICAALAG
jgi:hypothetical protein